MYIFKANRTSTKGIKETSNPFALSENVFRKYFRLSRAAVKLLIDDIGPELGSIRTARKMPARIQVLTALQLYGHGAYQKFVGQNICMAMGQSSVSVCLKLVTKAIIKSLCQ